MCRAAGRRQPVAAACAARERQAQRPHHRTGQAPGRLTPRPTGAQPARGKGRPGCDVRHAVCERHKKAPSNIDACAATQQAQLATLRPPEPYEVRGVTARAMQCSSPRSWGAALLALLAVAALGEWLRCWLPQQGATSNARRDAIQLAPPPAPPPPRASAALAATGCSPASSTQAAKCRPALHCNSARPRHLPPPLHAARSWSLPPPLRCCHAPQAVARARSRCTRLSGKCQSLTPRTRRSTRRVATVRSRAR